jgi:hypothetical protein
MIYGMLVRKSDIFVNHPDTGEKSELLSTGGVPEQIAPKSYDRAASYRELQTGKNIYHKLKK